MGLITCPDCQKEISELAESCPNCGRPMESKIQVPEWEGSKDTLGNLLGGKNKGCFSTTLNAGCLCILGMIVVSFVIGIIIQITGG